MATRLPAARLMADVIAGLLKNTKGLL